MRFLFALMFIACTIPLSGYEVVVRTPEGDINTISVAEKQSVADFLDTLCLTFGGESFCIVDVVGADYADFIRKATLHRDYSIPLTSSQKKDIAYIVNTLGMASLLKIAKERSSLKKAGDRLESIHPFHFVGTIFSDEEMKSSIHAMKNRGWVWADFFEGINSSMTDEQKNNNIQPYIYDFAVSVGIEPYLIIPSIESGNWKEFVNILIEKIPRSKNNNRYQM